MGAMSDLDIELKSSAERAERLRKPQTCVQEYLICLLKTKGLTEDFLDFSSNELGSEMLLIELRNRLKDVIEAIEGGEIK